MGLLEDAHIALLSGLTNRTDAEIHWYDEQGDALTIEPVDIENGGYIVRYYFSNGQKHWETEYYNERYHGKMIMWYKSGQIIWEEEYQNGKRHGRSIGWYQNGWK